MDTPDFSSRLAIGWKRLKTKGDVSRERFLRLETRAKEIGCI